MSQTLETQPSQPLRVAIHQPNFLPRLKVLQKLAYSDVWCVLDSVQLCKREWQNRARIVTTHGNNKSFWLTIPVRRTHRLDTLISEVVIGKPDLTGPLVEQTLRHAFRRAPHWAAINDLLPAFKPLLATDNLTRLCVDTTCVLLRIANRQPTVLLASSLPVTGKASNLMASLCRHLKATTYLADSGARNYLQPTGFAGIEVVWQNWHEPMERWPGISSWRNISGINYLCRVGSEQFAQHLISGEFAPEPTWRSPVYTPISSVGDRSAN
jgi:hypothetical protein